MEIKIKIHGEFVVLVAALAVCAVVALHLFGAVTLPVDTALERVEPLRALVFGS